MRWSFRFCLQNDGGEPSRKLLYALAHFSQSSNPVIPTKISGFDRKIEAAEETLRPFLRSLDAHNMIYHKNPVEESFISWITLNPDSFHHLDMSRFYVFVRSVVCYNARSWQNFKKFKSEVLRHKPNFKEENIEYFYNLMNHMISFYKSGYLPKLEVDGYSKTTVRKVVNGKIIIEDLQE